MIECAQMMPLSLALAHSAVCGACLSVCVSTSQQLNGARDLGFLFHCSCSRCGLHIFRSFYVRADDDSTVAERARYWCAECLKQKLQGKPVATYRLAQRRPISATEPDVSKQYTCALNANEQKRVV